MLTSNTYYPFTPESTFILNRSKRPISDIVGCSLYPSMQTQTLLHISSIQNKNKVIRIGISDIAGTEVCHTSDISRAVGDIRYYYVVDNNNNCCGVIAVKNNGRLFTALPSVYDIASDSYIFDPLCAKQNIQTNTYNVKYNDNIVSSIELSNAARSEETSAQQVCVRSINGIKARHFIFMHTPTSTTGVGKDAEGIIIARRADLI